MTEQTEYSPANEEFQLQNIAEILSEEFLDSISLDLLEKIKEDDKSREGWIRDHEEYLNLAAQVKEEKNFPWKNASNVKFPLLTNACLQFHARALPALVESSRPIKPKIIGRDPQGEKLRRGMRVSTYMSYQILEEMDEWVDDLDRLLFILPMIGLCYKKTYYSPAVRRLKSVLLTPKEVIVNYEARNFERARITEVLEVSNNELIELQREGLWRDCEFSEPQQNPNKNMARDKAKNITPPKRNSDTPYEFYESHCWLDIDEDGYDEPYIVTLEKESGKIVRITPRWTPENLIMDEQGRVVKIKAENFFTPWIFFPDPHSAVSGIGFGTLLGPNNEAINTIINQLIDAGTKENLGGGFIGRGAKLKGGALRFVPGEWKLVNTVGDDLRKSFVPLPTAPPSGALFNLLQLLISVGDQTGNMTDMIKGQNPGQNQKVGTTMAVLEQGMKVYSSIYRRLHRALTKEYKQIYNLNKQYLDEDLYVTVLDEVPSEQEILAMAQQQGLGEEQLQQVLKAREEHINAGRDDFEDEKVDVVPASEPSMISDTLRLMKGQSLMEKMGMGLRLNPDVVTRRVLEAEQHEDIDELMDIPQPPPSLEDRRFLLELIQDQREHVNSQFDNLLKVAQAEGVEKGNQIAAYTAALNSLDKQFDREYQETKQNATGQSQTTQ